MFIRSAIACAHSCTTWHRREASRDRYSNQHVDHFDNPKYETKHAHGMHQEQHAAMRASMLSLCGVASSVDELRGSSLFDCVSRLPLLTQPLG